MSNIKERILGAVTVMDESEAYAIWDIIINYFSDSDWNKIKTVQPDEFDKKMLSEIDRDPDCKDFISSEELKTILGLQ